jgi:hypothetical protein
MTSWEARASPPEQSKSKQSRSQSCPCRAIESGSVDSEFIAVRLSPERFNPQGPWIGCPKGGTSQAKMDSLTSGGGVQDHSERQEVVQEPVRAYPLLGKCRIGVEPEYQQLGCRRQDHSRQSPDKGTQSMWSDRGKVWIRQRNHAKG